MAKKGSKFLGMNLSKKQLLFLGGAILALLIILGFVLSAFGILNTVNPTAQSDLAAIVNGEEISILELDLSYSLALPEEYRPFISKWEFLNQSVIPQKLLLDEAEKKGISVSEEEIDSELGLIADSFGMAKTEMIARWNLEGLSESDVRKTYASQLMIFKYLNNSIFPKVRVRDSELERIFEGSELALSNVSFEDIRPFLSEQVLIEKQTQATQEEIARLRKDANITFILEETKKEIISFSPTGDPICAKDEKVIIRMFTTSSCTDCKPTASNLGSVLRAYEKFYPITGFIWELDSGDNLLTQEKEKGIPKEEVALFKKYDPSQTVPFYLFGCAYVREGNMDNQTINLNKEENEFKEVINALLIEYGY